MSNYFVQSTLAASHGLEQPRRFACDRAGSVLAPVGMLLAGGVVGGLLLVPGQITERRILTSTLEHICKIAATDIARAMNKAVPNGHDQIFTPHFQSVLDAAINTAARNAGNVLEHTYTDLPDLPGLPDKVSLSAEQLSKAEWTKFVAQDPVNGLGIKAPFGRAGTTQVVPLEHYTYIDHSKKVYTGYKSSVDYSLISGSYRDDFIVDVYKVSIVSSNDTINEDFFSGDPDNLSNNEPVSIECYGVDYYSIQLTAARRGLEVMGVYGGFSYLYPSFTTQPHYGGKSKRRAVEFERTSDYMAHERNNQERLCYGGSSKGMIRILMYDREMILRRALPLEEKSSWDSGRPAFRTSYTCVDTADGLEETEPPRFLKNDGEEIHYESELNRTRDHGIYEPFMFYKGFTRKAVEHERYRHVGVMHKGQGETSEDAIPSVFTEADGTPIQEGELIRSGPHRGKFSHDAWPGVITQNLLNIINSTEESYHVSAGIVTEGVPGDYDEKSNPAPLLPGGDPAITKLFGTVADHVRWGYSPVGAWQLMQKFAATFEPGAPGFLYCKDGKIAYEVTAASIEAYMKKHGYVAWRTSFDLSYHILKGDIPGFNVSGMIDTSEPNPRNRLPYRHVTTNGISRQVTLSELKRIYPKLDVPSNINFIPIAEVGSKAIEAVKYGTESGDKINIYQRLYTDRVVAHMGDPADHTGGNHKHYLDGWFTMHDSAGAMPLWMFVSPPGGRVSFAWSGYSHNIDAYDFHPSTFYKTQYAHPKHRIDYFSGETWTKEDWAEVQSHWRGTDGGFQDIWKRDHLATYRLNYEMNGKRWTQFGIYDDDVAVVPSHPLVLRRTAQMDLKFGKYVDYFVTGSSWAEAGYGHCRNISVVWTVSGRTCHIQVEADPSGLAEVRISLEDAAWWRTADHGLVDGDGWAANPTYNNAHGALADPVIKPGHEACVMNQHTKSVRERLGTETFVPSSPKSGRS